MTPREKNWAGWVSAFVAVLFLLGGAFAFGSSLVANDREYSKDIKTIKDELRELKTDIRDELREIKAELKKGRK